jgi:uncharacterized SAM-binding protein YcdF (DUF218 family)
MTAAMVAALIAVPVLAAAMLLGLALLRHFGRWLVVDDPLEPARAIVVLGGNLPYAALCAAEIYREGWAPEIWLQRYRPLPEELILASMGIEVPEEQTFSRRVLEHRGVPPEAIHAIELGGDTAAEVDYAAARMRMQEGRNTVIVVTCKSRTRRIKVLWKALAGPSLKAIVRYTADDPFVPDRWFLNTRDVQTVAHEFLGLLNAWAGLPIRAEKS